MSFDDLSPNSQDYLKAIWDLMEWSGEPAQLSDIVEKTGMKLSTVSGAIGRLTAQGLVSHTPYGAVELTDEGRSYALVMARRHRLLETFLVHTLGYRWDEVHDEADRLEHAVSDTMIERIDAMLGHPSRDPHGDPIPTADGTVDSPDLLSLADARPGEHVRVERVSDSDPDLLAYLTEQGLRVGSTLLIGNHTPYSHTVNFTIESVEPAEPVKEAAPVNERAGASQPATASRTPMPIALDLSAADAIRVTPIDK